MKTSLIIKNINIGYIIWHKLKNEIRTQLFHVKRSIQRMKKKLGVKKKKKKKSVEHKQNYFGS